MSATNIILVGFMGSGKSSIGRLLAKHKQSFFLDTDALIESFEGKRIVDIFDDSGEGYFRDLERQTVMWLKESVANSVISTGGGMLVYCEELNDAGTVVYLKVPFETILSRMNTEELEKRPLFKDREKAHALYKKRNAIYEARADLVIDADDTIENVFKRVLDAKI